MRRGSRSALQGLTGVLALIALTWPLLVFDRPLYVLVSFFAIWAAVIALLFVFSRAPEADEEASGAPREVGR